MARVTSAIIAGISYELLRWSGTHGGETLARILAAPGLWLQRLTTGVPEESMIEVAVTSLLSALEALARTTDSPNVAAEIVIAAKRLDPALTLEQVFGWDPLQAIRAG